MRETVKRGDCLWSLAHRYLGSGTRYPHILHYHNKEAARSGLRHIDQPDLIFVGETILIPSRPKVPKPDTDTGTRAEGCKPAIPVSLKVTYVIGRDTPPIVYTTSYGDFTIKTEVSGGIDIEIASHDRYRHNFELLMSKDPVQARQKLHDAYDPAIIALTAKPEMVFESGKVKIEAPIATAANLGPFTIEVQAVTPMQMSGILKPSTISGILEMGPRKFKFSADIEFRADVIWHQRPKGEQEPITETVRQKIRQKKIADKPTGHTTKWEQTVAEKGVVVAVVLVMATGVGLALSRIITRGGLQPAQIMPPFIHTIDRRNPRA
jgi:hypothetical protein